MIGLVPPDRAVLTLNKMVPEIDVRSFPNARANMRIAFASDLHARRGMRISAIADKIAGLRVFEDADDKMNLSLKDVGGSVLLVSQFTLLADARHGRRPNFVKAARPEQAEPLCERLREMLAEQGVPTLTGRFRTHMEVELLNDGPVTILLDSKKGF